MDPLLDVLALWIRENAVVAVLAALAVPLALAFVVDLAGRGRAAAPAEEPEPLESAAAPEPVPPAEAAPPREAVAEPAPEPEPEPEPEAVPAAAPQPEPAVVSAPPVPEPVPEPEVAPPPPEPEVAPPPPPPVRLGERLRRTHQNFVGRLGALVGGRSVDADLLEELEAVLLGADLGVRTADSLLEEVRRNASGKDASAVRDVLRDAIRERLKRVEAPAPVQDAKPHVVVVLGVNGSGKTTTIGKLAARQHAMGRKVILGAGDTFRAAAIEQLQTWGERVGCTVIAGQAGGDPSAVAFDTVKAAVARGADVAIIDTAGRLQTKRPLMEELGKLVRVIGRECEGAPHETLLVLDANTGQNAISQARLFTEVAGVSGLALTKLDGTAKGGVVVGLADEFGIPIRYVGVGEAIEDLRDFSADEFVEALFEEA